MSKVELKNVSKVYGGSVVAARNINLSVADRELLVLVGPSGCGKSTVLRMVAGLEEITEGEILFDGQVVNDLSPKERNIAMVFQNYALYPHMNVYDNMAFALKLRKYPKEEIHKRVMEAASILGIEELLKRKPKALSGGQRQRVALGRAIVRKPNVFLFDEPLSNLDAKMRVQMRTEIRRLNLDIETTMIYVTHDQIEAMTLGDRLAVMNKGEIMQVGTPLELYSRPANMFVAAFIGSPAMNFFDAEIIGGEGSAEGISGGNGDQEDRSVVSDVEGTVSGGSAATEHDPKIGSGRGSGGEAPSGSGGGMGGSSSRLSLRTSFTTIPVPEKFMNTLKVLDEKEIVIGVRPEDIYVGKPGTDGGGYHGARAVIDLVEPLGNEIIFHLRSDGVELVAREDPSKPGRHGDNVDIYFDLSKLHLFSKETDKALL